MAAFASLPLTSSSLHPVVQFSPLVFSSTVVYDPSSYCLTVRSIRHGKQKFSPQTNRRSLIILGAATKQAKTPGILF